MLKKILPSFTQTLCIFIIMVSIFTSTKLIPVINHKRAKYKLTQNKPLENAPPELVIATTALGGLRAFIIDYLWLRSTQLSNSGNHYEIIQLYDWIGKLEPRIPEVWSFTAWEMAYNISITMPTPKERWRWLYGGIKQLRDFGLFYNQKTLKLYWDLSFMIYDKITMSSADEYHHYYQKYWFINWQQILSPCSNLEKIANAPENFNELEKEPGVKKILSKFESQEIDLFSDFYKVYQNTKVRELMKKQDIKGMEKILAYVVKKHIKEKLKMDPQKMLLLNKKYGDLNWRLPSCHSLYWAQEGLNILKKRKKLKVASVNRNLYRLKYLSLKENFEYGKILGITKERVVCVPNFSVLEPLRQYYLEVQKRWKKVGIENYEDFLLHAIKKCYLYNQIDKAEKYYKILKNKFHNPAYKLNFDKFVVKDIGRTINFGRQHIVEDYIIAKQAEAYFYLLLGKPEKFDKLSIFVIAAFRRYKEREGQEENLKSANRSRTLDYFRRSAVKLLKKKLEKKLGKDIAKKTWQQIIIKFPIFNELMEDK